MYVRIISDDDRSDGGIIDFETLPRVGDFITVHVLVDGEERFRTVKVVSVRWDAFPATEGGHKASPILHCERPGRPD